MIPAHLEQVQTTWKRKSKNAQGRSEKMREAVPERVWQSICVSLKEDRHLGQNAISFDFQSKGCVRNFELAALQHVFEI